MRARTGARRFWKLKLLRVPWSKPSRLGAVAKFKVGLFRSEMIPIWNRPYH